MNPNDVIEAYVIEVMRHLPGRQRNEIGVELRGLLVEMLDGRAEAEGRRADDAMVLTMLRDFGSPADVAARYRAPGMVIIPPEQTRSFAALSLLGIGLQWALTLPRVFQGQDPGAWWLSAGLGALWWPGFLVMIALVAAAWRARGVATAWRPNAVDPDRIRPRLVWLGIVGTAVGAIFMTALPWTSAALPDPMPAVFAFDAGFLHGRAWLAPALWLAQIGLSGVLLAHGRWTRRLRNMELGLELAWIAVLVGWLAAGPFFTAPMTNEGARGAIALVIVFIVIDVAVKIYRRRTRLRPLASA